MADESSSAKVASEEASITPGPGVGEEEPHEKSTGKEDRKEQTPPAPEPKDDLVTTHHVLRVGRRRLKYTATAGRVVLREEDHEDGTFKGNKARGVISMTSYVLDDADPRTRPVVFAFNGGPGSSSVWLHLGLLGPRRVVMGDVGALEPPPYGLVDNAESLLAVADLVFVDPMSTGWSRAVEGGKPGDYHGFQRDVEHVGELIRLWTSRNRRWMSPKFVAGESYGTLRGAALTAHLQDRYGMYLNGLILISSVLDLSSIDFEKQRNDRAHALYLPTYAAIAHYHGKHGRRSLRSVVEEAESYAARDLPWVLSRGARLSPQERSAAVATLARLSGLSEDYVDRCDLRIEHWRYFTELLRDQRLSVGRLDGRFTGPAASAIAEGMDADPSYDAIMGPYAAAWNHYVRDELEYDSDLHYEQITTRVQPWSYKDFEGRPVDVSDRLERAMRQNPHLRVHVAYGYYDGATPHFAAEDVLARLHLPASLRTNIEHAYYEAGHMMYVHEPSRVQQSRDLADFVVRSSARST
ncbi:S10 family peptidase [Intrasporangium calvum]|uniref:Peptidase S10 serine carboxypeptidase n=1 Tax=Intrasporangium calvum (strain ATCC 23552 / DSM 43043 / JCM 3097 / NBRC 12989 / NCIMB 10167 / NRRL B-3866 / 7 KIP) TaxID=710696 RepID=E6SDJ6_INTC7|nr:peptidase S10 [Intrasporangium calvum]ADU48648.1 peptidase S10 serine carboxypeptidase [Intrasporangium calvum DSM 43043]AXG13648.1 peptidase S10 [Intrasporangium calvum]